MAPPRDTAPPPPTTIAAAQPLGDLPCAGCGYNLRGLTRDGRCPECGAPVADSLLRGPMAACDPAWVRRVATGVVLFNLIHLYFLAFGPGLRAPLSYAFRTPWLMTGVTFGAVAGAYLLASPEPSTRHRWPTTSLRLAALAWAAVIAVWIGWRIVTGWLPDYRPVVWLLVALPVLTLILGLHEMHALARRIGDTPLALQLRFVGGGYVLLLVLLHPFTFTLVDWTRLLPSNPRPIIEVTFSAFVLCLIWAIFLAGRLRQALPVPRRASRR